MARINGKANTYCITRYLCIYYCGLIMESILMSEKPANELELEKLLETVSVQLAAGQPTLDSTANKLMLSPRTLQRRLEKLGLTYTQLVDEVRFKNARLSIMQGIKITQIATELGYADAGSFTRAFERWTGMSPQKYRNTFTKQ